MPLVTDAFSPHIFKVKIGEGVLILDLHLGETSPWSITEMKLHPL